LGGRRTDPAPPPNGAFGWSADASSYGDQREDALLRAGAAERIARSNRAPVRHSGYGTTTVMLVAAELPAASKANAAST
jgi:hypothetical protein